MYPEARPFTSVSKALVPYHVGAAVGIEEVTGRFSQVTLHMVIAQETAIASVTPVPGRVQSWSPWHGAFCGCASAWVMQPSSSPSSSSSSVCTVHGSFPTTSGRVALTLPQTTTISV